MYVWIVFPEFSPLSRHKALVDSGTAGNFIDHGLANRLGIPLVQLDKPFPVHALDSRPLGSGLVREATAPLDMVTQEGHEERISVTGIKFLCFNNQLKLITLSIHKRL